MAKVSDKFASDRHGWAELLPERRAGDALTGSHRAACVVIGAGFTGLSCAERLGELNPEKQIFLLEARLVGEGSSGRNSGYAVAVSQFSGGFERSEIPEYKRINRINAQGLALLRQRVMAKQIECQWDENGFYHTAADKASKREYEYFTCYLEAMEIEHRVLDQQQLSERLGTETYKLGVHVPIGALVQPAALVRGLADNLPENVRLFEQTPVLGLKDGDKVTVQLAGGKVIADEVFIATNYEAVKIGFLRGRILGSTLAGSFTRILSDDERASLGSLEQWGVLSLHSGGATVRLTEDGRLCLRNTAEYHGGELMSEAELLERQKIHRESFERRFPQLVDVPFEFAWSGVEGISRNFTNFFGRQRSNIYLAGGYNGSGVSRGTAFGTALAEYAAGGQSQLISDCLASQPAGWIPPRPLLDIGAKFTVASRFRGVGLDR